MQLKAIYARPEPELVTGDELLALAERAKNGELTITLLQRTKQNGLWKVTIKKHETTSIRH